MTSRRWQRSRSELLLSLATQMKAIEASSHSYDAGNTWEAVRLASAVYILVHDGSKKVQSIFTQLGVRGSLRFISYATPGRPGNLVRETPLVMLRLTSGEGAKYIPKLGDGPLPPHQVQFHTWWEDEKIYREPDTHFLNRRRLVWSLRDQEGGGHLDAEITDPAYIRFSRETEGGWITSVNGVERKVMDGHLATMRHIAWEIQETVRLSPDAEISGWNRSP